MPTTVSHRDVPHLSAGTKLRRVKKGVGAARLHVFLAMLTTRLESHQSQRPQNHFYSNNKCTLLVGLFKMARTRSPQRWYAVLADTSGGWGDIFSSLVMTYWKGTGQPETGAGVGVVS